MAIDLSKVAPSSVGQRPPAGDGRVPVGALRGVRPAVQVLEGRVVRGDQPGPRAALDAHVADGHALFHRQRPDGLAAVLEDVAGPAADADPGDQGQDDVLGADARREPAVDADLVGLRVALEQASGSPAPSRPRSSRSRRPAPRTRRASTVCESPQTMVMPGWVRPSCGPMTWTMPWLGEPMPWSGMPNSRAVVLQLADLRRRLRVEHRQAARGRRDRVVRGGDGLGRPADAAGRAARSPVNACGEVTSWTRWRSTARTAGAPGSWVTTWSVQILSTMVRGLSVGMSRGVLRAGFGVAEASTGRPRPAGPTGGRRRGRLSQGASWQRSSYAHRYDGARPPAPSGRITTFRSPPATGGTHHHRRPRAVQRRPGSCPRRSSTGRPTCGSCGSGLFLALVAMFAIPIAIAAPLVYTLASDDGATIVLPTVAILILAAVLGAFTVWLARRVLEPAERLDRVRVVLEDAYARAHAESLRDSLTGLGNHRAFQEEFERQWAGAARYQQRFALAIIDLDDFRRINDVEGHVGGDRVLVGVADDADRRAASDRPGLPHRRRRVRGPDARGRRRASLPVAAARAGDRPRGSRGHHRARDDEPRGRGRSRPASPAYPGTATDRATLFREADAALLFGKRHGRTCITVFDPERHTSARERTSEEVAASVAQVASTGALTRGLPADLRPAQRGRAWLRGPHPAAARLGLRRPGRAVRGGRGGRADGGAGPRLHGHLHRRVRPARAGRQPDPQRLAADDGIGRLQRPRPRPAAAAARDRPEPGRPGADRARRDRGHGQARPGGRGVSGRGHAARGRRRRGRQRGPAPALAAAVRHRQDRPLAGPGWRRPGTSQEVVRTLKDLADRWGALVIAEGVETPEQLEFVRSLGIRAGQGYLLGRPTERPSSEPIDVARLVSSSGDWLVDRLRSTPSGSPA